MTTLTINGEQHEVELDEAMPLLWAIRDVLGFTGTKFGCGIGMCGACSVHVDGRLTRSCITPVAAVKDKPITTIEGLAEGDKPHPVQEAWAEADVPQCGYCQSGQIMAAVALLKDNPNPSDEEIREKMTNLCRCGTYLQIFSAVKDAVKRQRGTS